jgi:hypothetical protein
VLGVEHTVIEGVDLEQVGTEEVLVARVRPVRSRRGRCGWSQSSGKVAGTGLTCGIRGRPEAARPKDGVNQWLLARSGVVVHPAEEGSLASRVLGHVRERSSNLPHLAAETGLFRVRSGGLSGGLAVCTISAYLVPYGPARRSRASRRCPINFI